MFQEEEFYPITPVNFFQFSLDAHYREPNTFNKKNIGQYILPDLSALCDDQCFADVYLAWNKEGIELTLQASKKFDQAYYPDIFKGDSFEVFIDTRDVKTSGYNTRFCHHFFFLPEAVEGFQKGEKTHFRTEDSHELCD